MTIEVAVSEAVGAWTLIIKEVSRKRKMKVLLIAAMLTMRKVMEKVVMIVYRQSWLKLNKDSCLIIHHLIGITITA